MTGAGQVHRGRRPRRPTSLLAVAVAVAVGSRAVAGCANLDPDPSQDSAPDLTFGVRQVADDRQGGFVVVSGTSWARYDGSGAGSQSTGSLPWHAAAVASLPDGRLVVATSPSGDTQTPQIAVVDLETGADEVLVGRPEQRPLPLAPGEPVSPDGTLASDAYLGTVLDVEVMPDGSVVWLEQLWVEFAEQNLFAVRRVAADGTLQTVAGRSGDPASVHAAPLAGAAAPETVLDAADPRLAPTPDGSIVVATQAWVVRVGTDGVLSELAPGLVACADEPALAEAAPDGLLLVRVARSSALTISADSWVVREQSEAATEHARAARDAAPCAVVAVRPVSTPAVPAVLEPVQDVDGSTVVAFYGDGELVAAFPGSGDLSALVRLARP